jgi:prefoldin subunit 5
MARKKPSREELDRLITEGEESLRQLRERIARMKAELEAKGEAEAEPPLRRRRFFLFG